MRGDPGGRFPSVQIGQLKPRQEKERGQVYKAGRGIFGRDIKGFYCRVGTGGSLRPLVAQIFDDRLEFGPFYCTLGTVASEIPAPTKVGIHALPSALRLSGVWQTVGAMRLPCAITPLASLKPHL